MLVDPAVVIAQQYDPAYMAQRAIKLAHAHDGKQWTYSEETGQWTLETVYSGSVTTVAR